MTRAGGFSVDDEEILETVARMLRAGGAVEAAALLRASRSRFELTGRDNWDGGTNTYTLTIEIAAETLVAMGERKTQVQEQISKTLGEVVEQFHSGWYTVKLAPLVVAIPGRPDLEGGPVAYQTRRAILNVLRDEGVSWQGEVDDTTFLETIYDLDALPSYDSRFKTAARDIWQHRVNNPEDWSNDWLFSDERFDLIGGPDVKFLMFVERLVSPDVRSDRRLAAALADRLNQELRQSGWTLVERETPSGRARHRIEPWDPLFQRMEQSLRVSAAVLSSSWMHQEVERIESAIDTDPALAIGTAKDMIETCCKHIAEALKVELPPNPDVPVLVKAVLKSLQLVPEGIPENKKGAESVKRILSNLSQITQGLSELRTLYGTGHGRSSSHRGLSVRHARLAVGAAATFVEFLVATYRVRQDKLDRVA